MAAPPGRPAGRAELPPVLRRLRDLPAWLVHVHGGHRLGGAGQRGQRHRRGVRVRGRRGPPGAAARVRRRGRGPPRTAPGDAAADVLRCAAQAGLAAALFAGRPAIWLFVLLAWLEGSGEAFFRPALGALTVEIAPRDQLGNANALHGLATSATRIGGPGPRRRGGGPPPPPPPPGGVGPPRPPWARPPRRGGGRAAGRAGPCSRT